MIAFLFPGQGSQAVGMGKALADAFPEARAAFDEADAALGRSLSGLCFDGPDDQLTLTENTQPAILATSIAAWRVLEARGLAPAWAAGHSLGEYSAHVAAGTFAFADAVRIVSHRGRYMQEAVPVGTGAMAAILGLDAATVTAACDAAAQGEVVSPANLNAPGQVVIAGTKAAVERAGVEAKARGRQAGHRPERERAVPLRADGAGAGAPRTGAAGARRCRRRACRWWPTSTRSRDATPRRPSTRSSRRSPAPCAGRTSSGILCRLVCARMLRWARARCSQDWCARSTARLRW